MPKKVVLYVLILCMFIPLISCKFNNKAKNATNNTSDIEKKSEKTNLEMWIMPNDSQNSEKDVRILAKQFLKENPNVKLNITVLDWGIAFKKISDALTDSGEKPDITQMGTTWVGMMASLKPGLMDIGGKYNPKDFVEGSLATTKILGKDRIVAIPWFIDTRLLYYRKDACRIANVDPKTDFNTWDSFKEALKKLNNVEVDGVKMSAFGMAGKNDWNVPHNFSWWIWGAGGDFLSKDAKKSVLDQPEALKGIEYYTQLVKDGLLSKEALMKNSVDVGVMFKKGKFATTITDASQINVLKVKDKDSPKDYNPNNFGVTMIPKGPAGRVAFFGGSVLSVLESSKNKELSIELLKQLSSKEAQVRCTKQIGHLPALKAAYDDPSIKDDSMKSVMKEQIKYGKSYPSIPQWGTIEAILMKEMGELWDITLSDYDVNKIENKVKLISKNVDKVLKQ